MNQLLLYRMCIAIDMEAPDKVSQSILVRFMFAPISPFVGLISPGQPDAGNCAANE